MKTLIILFAIMILPSLGGVGGGVYAQIVTIPDPIFKALLIMEGVDTNNDGEIQVSEAEAVTGMLDVSIHFPAPIYDLTGIEAFINITGLNVWGNQLTTLDLNNNSLLTELYCYNNNLTYLNVENCINLEILESSQNQLMYLDLKTNLNLRTMIVNNNKLTYLDIRNGNNTSVIEYFHAGNNPDLICIFVDDAEYSENSPVWFKDATSTYVETQAECDALGIEDLAFENLKIYPNPVKDILYIDIPNNHDSVEISIVDIKGSQVLNRQMQSKEIMMDISHLESGMYFMIVKDLQTKEILTKKLIKI